MLQLITNSENVPRQKDKIQKQPKEPSTMAQSAQAMAMRLKFKNEYEAFKRS